ncbi:outer membrane lipid asymmetry maintenance protein MlaD [Desulforhopalus singaporensis]|uniref:Phospholipid/cholesterol/gamma-HCH transport system substrate-binding protein n=1 Tax=Desulforhopalus singaporensis TaxID=91360 RepID=A0A1H0MLE8_9BACT|nr:outer membrane lipid asymmetry maintenance protein MlaD [Desulforhopalus singaporensis]SDO81288.1 phospholipid/cholesterol/gamma-HCH transport system substrate-binding protein [Desulforhopalus singaporensis]
MTKKTLEMSVGVFMLLGFAAFVYLALQLGEVPFLKNNDSYIIRAEFDNVAGVKKGASVQVAGVVVGDVADVRLGDREVAILALRLENGVKVPTDSIASVKSQGIIGDKYIQLSLGGDEENIDPGGVIVETESSLDIESLISKFAFGSAQ